ncbi:hypothetical protein U1Q18_028314 [Sarracenia purpurea var. burkii]
MSSPHVVRAWMHVALEVFSSHIGSILLDCKLHVPKKRFMTMSRMMAGKTPPNNLAVISRQVRETALMFSSCMILVTCSYRIKCESCRVFSTLVHFVGCIHSKEDILSFIQRSHPPIIFDSSFLKLQAPLLERTLDHPNSTISNPTITFWNSTYAKEKLDYPQCLLSVLDKLYRNGIIHISKISPQFIGKCHSRITGQNRSSKRVELVENEVRGVDRNDKKYSCPKRKRRELTEHQKEVRQAQQGREKDCNGRGPGIRTYTALDFSQGINEL